MKTLHWVVGVIAVISVTIFIISLVLLTITDGNHDLTLFYFQVSLGVSFVSLINFEPFKLSEK